MSRPSRCTSAAVRACQDTLQVRSMSRRPPLQTFPPSRHCTPLTLTGRCWQLAACDELGVKGLRIGLDYPQATIDTARPDLALHSQPRGQRK